MKNLNFRAWHQEKKKMYEVSSITWDKYQADKKVFELADDHITISCWANDIKLMQSTGLKDFKGAEIFEGDVLEIDKQDRCKVVWLGDHNYPAFDLEPSYTDECNALSHVFCGDVAFEVIGNIYEQPELLRDEDQDRSIKNDNHE